MEQMQVALRLHRLGTIHLASGRVEEALQALNTSCKSLTRNVGDANPLTGESRWAAQPLDVLSLHFGNRASSCSLGIAITP